MPAATRMSVRPRGSGRRAMVLGRMPATCAVAALLALVLARPASAAQVPFTGNLTIDFTTAGGTSFVIPGAGMATVNDAGPPSLAISKLTIPAGAFSGSGFALVDATSTVPAYYAIAGSTIMNSQVVLSAGGTCTAAHAQVACPGGGLAGFGGLPGFAARFLQFFTAVATMNPTGNVGAGSVATGVYNTRAASLFAAGWTSGAATALGTGFTGSQSAVGNTISLSLVSPIAITATGGGGGPGVARIDLSLMVPFADTPVDGKKLILKRSASGKEKIVFITKDPAFPFPPIGGGEDPSVAGMTVEVLSVIDGIGTLTIPPGESSPPGWKVKDKTVDLYKWVNPSAPDATSDVKVALIKEGKLTRIVAKSLGGFPLSTTQNQVAIRITHGAQRTCAVFGGDILKDRQDLFVAKESSGAAILDCTNPSLL